MVTAKSADTDRYRRAGRSAIRPTPVGATLARDELVAGLRCVYQRAGLELALASGKTESSALSIALRHASRQDIACTLADVAAQFGLAHGELVEIVGERMADTLQEAEHH